MKLALCLIAVVFMVGAIDAMPRCRWGCQATYQPICGSDGETYPNRCSLQLASCRTRGAIRFAYEGRCRPDANRDCLWACTLDYRPVCGSNGETYSNQCAMERKACELNEIIIRRKDGSC